MAADKTVVIIEDDTEAQEVYQQVLAKKGLRATFASTGKLGLQLIQSEKPVVIILDLILSGTITGTDVLIAIKKHRLMKRIPVIVVSNLHSQRDAVLELGAADFLPKAGTSVEALITHIKKHAKA